MNLLTVAQVAATYHVKAATVRRWLKRGELDGVRIVGRWRIPEENLETLWRKKRNAIDDTGAGAGDGALGGADNAR